MTTAVIRPGLLVSLKSTVSGGVTYERRDLDAPTAEVGRDVAKWETTRLIEDPAEHERATKARSNAVTEIRKLCSATSFGLLCPETAEAELDAAVARAKLIASEHNATAVHTKVEVFVLKGRIAASDAEAARAIGQEVAALIEGMNGAIDRLDPKAIKDAADKAKKMSSMLSPELASKVGDAVTTARAAARTIVRRVEKGGEEAAIVLADIQRGNIARARIAFLDLDTPEAPAAVGPALPAVDVRRFADLTEDDDASEPVSGEPVSEVAPLAAVA